MPAILIKYLPYILGAILIIGLCVAGYNHIYDSGVEHERLKWVKRDAETKAKSEALLAAKQAENAVIAETQRQHYITGITHYAQEIESLSNRIDDDRGKRMFVNTTSTGCDSNSLSAETGSPGGAGGKAKNVQRAELDRETESAIRATFAEIERGRIACQILLDEFIFPNFEVR